MAAGDNARRVRLVMPHRPLYQPPAVRQAGLTATLAVVLSTWRPDSPDLVLDQPLWKACMDAASHLAPAASVQLYGVAVSRLGGLFGKRRGAALGELADYFRQVSANEDATPDWELAEWRQDGHLVCAATCEPWYRVGGPAPYHDSWTTCFFVAPEHLPRLAAAMTAAVMAAGGLLE